MLISKNLISLELCADTKRDAIEQLAKLAEREGKISAYTDYVQDVFKRESEYTTGVGGGIAIPHAKSQAVKEAMIVFGRFRNKIEWNSADDKPVNMVFLLGVPSENIDNLHLKIISQLARSLVNEDFVQFLQNAQSKDEIFNYLSGLQVS